MTIKHLKSKISQKTKGFISPRLLRYAAAIAVVATVFSLVFTNCTRDKLLEDSANANPQGNWNGNGGVSERDGEFSASNAALEQSYQDTIAHQVVLSEDTVSNPYLIPNMTQAFLNVYGRVPGVKLPVTHLYVQFLPKKPEQAIALFENEAIEQIKAYPLNRKVIVQGEFYVPPGATPDNLPPFYAVVKSNFIFPSDINYVILQTMFIPDDAPTLENEAFKLVNMIKAPNVFISNEAIIIAKVRENPAADYPKELGRIDGTGFATVENPPSAGLGGRGTKCKGRVQVQNILNTHYREFNPIRHILVSVHNFWKTDKQETNDDGYFTGSKSFNKSADVDIIYTNDLGREQRYVDWWQFFWSFGNPTEKSFGSHSSGDLGNLDLKVYQSNAMGTGSCLHWCAAVTHNAVREHREMCLDEKVGLPPLGLHLVMRSNLSPQHGGTLMLHDMVVNGTAPSGTDLESLAYSWFIRTIVPALSVTKSYLGDIRLGYGQGDIAGVNTAAFLTTDRYCELVYHELSHASHYKKEGAGYWTQLGVAEYLNPMLYPNSDGVPYGSTNTQYSPIITVGEGWAYHMGRYLTDKKWGYNAVPFTEQGVIDKHPECDGSPEIRCYYNSNNRSGSINFLETYDPDFIYDPNRWIPKGLMWDLMDEAAENTPVHDNVYGYNNKKIFDALDNDVKTMQQFRNRLLQENGNSYSSAVYILFHDYHFD